jgi:hypothetical protein
MDAEQYRRQAEYALAYADLMTEPKDRAAFLELAAEWTRMAEEAERDKGVGPT